MSPHKDEGKEMQFTTERNSEFDSSRTDLLAPPRTAFGTADCPREGKEKTKSVTKKTTNIDKYKN